MSSVCTCLKDIYASCITNPMGPDEYFWANDPEVGRLVYTVAMLLIFSAIIVLLMFRSIKRSSSAIEMEALLDAMRFREELDIQQRQKRRLLKAKTKVAAWLTKTQGKEDRGWRSAPQLLPPRKQTSSSNSEIPEIVVTEDVPLADSSISRSRTPALSLIYDFENSPDAYSRFGSCSENGNLSAKISDSSIPSIDRRSLCSSLGSQASIYIEQTTTTPRPSIPSIPSVHNRRTSRLSCNYSPRTSMSLDQEATPPRMSISSHSMSID